MNNILSSSFFFVDSIPGGTLFLQSSEVDPSTTFLPKKTMESYSPSFDLYVGQTLTIKYPLEQRRRTVKIIQLYEGTITFTPPKSSRWKHDTKNIDEFWNKMKPQKSLSFCNNTYEFVKGSLICVKCAAEKIWYYGEVMKCGKNSKVEIRYYGTFAIWCWSSFETRIVSFRSLVCFVTHVYR